MKTVDFNYFYKQFISYIETKLITNIYNKNYPNINYRVYSGTFDVPEKEQLSFFDEALAAVCKIYSLIDSIEILAEYDNVFELVKHIIQNSNGENKQAFLISMQFILRDYISFLGMGNPVLFVSQNGEEEASLDVILDDDYRIRDLESVNMSEEETTQRILDLTTMIRDRKQGPLNRTRMIKYGASID